MRIFKTLSLLLRRRYGTSNYPAVFRNHPYTYKNLSTIESYEDYTPDIEDTRHRIKSVKTLLYPNSSDRLIIEINSCTCLLDVMNFVRSNLNNLDHTHLSQIVLALRDLQQMFSQTNSNMPSHKFKVMLDDYCIQLIELDEFKLLLELIESKVEEFDIEALSSTLMHLNKIGLNMFHPTTQLLERRLKSKLLEGDFSLTAISRYMITIHKPSSVSTYLSCEQLIPAIFKSVDKCKTSQDLSAFTQTLNPLYRIVSDDLLQKYKNKVIGMIKDGVINKQEIDTILRVAMFLHYPQWRDQNVTLTSQCISLMKGHLDALTVHELLTVYNLFEKNQEPADILNELQRCASKFLHELEEEESLLLDIRLKLLACVLCFSRPIYVGQLDNALQKYLRMPMTGENMMDFLKLMLTLKISNFDICKTFFNKLLNVMEHDIEFKNNNLLKIGLTYLHFSHSVKYNHSKLEKRLNQWFEGEIEQGIMKFIPSKFSGLSAFVIAFGKDISVLNFVAQKLTNEYLQYKPKDCSIIAKGLQVGLDNENPYLRNRYLAAIRNTLDMTILKELQGDLNSEIAVELSRACIHRSRSEQITAYRLLDYCKRPEYVSTKLIKHLTFCMHCTNSLIPEVLDTMVDYICENRDNVMASNGENVAYLCYSMGYVPKQIRKFCSVFTDIILRDQERIAGLAYLQSCLSLCFYNSVSDTLIKHVFNPIFLEKLEFELDNCYSKDTYPMRVRERLMELNRVVCIDHPQTNVPWFHQKYLEESKRKASLDKVSEPYNAYNKVRDYLIKIFKNPGRVSSNVTTPYGYNIDYVVSLDDNPDMPDKVEDNSNKFAVLLLRSNAYTKVNVQLKGQIQVKLRHIEMFGYRVALMNINEWNNLVYGEDKINYLKRLFAHNKRSVNLINR